MPPPSDWTWWSPITTECKEELPAAGRGGGPPPAGLPLSLQASGRVGVALKLVLALGGESREDRCSPGTAPWRPSGTIADVMRMEGENRDHRLLRAGGPAPHGLCGHPRSAAGGGAPGKARHLHPDRLRPLSTHQCRRRMGEADLAADLLEDGGPPPGRRSWPRSCAT